MLALVTGGTGFIGGHLVRGLLDSGHQVRCLVRDTSDTSRLEASGVDVRRCSLADLEAVSDACRGVDVAFNLAGRLGRPPVTEREMHLANAAAVGTLLEAGEAGGVHQVVHCSTPGVVGTVGVAPECLPYHPIGSYERSKCEGEKAALSYHKRGRLRVTVLRPDFVYGPGDLHKLKLFQAIRNRRFPILGRGTSLLHPTFVSDVVRGFLLVTCNPAAYGGIFNIAGPEPVTVADLVSAIADAVGVKPPRVHVPVAAAKAAALGAEALARVLGREPALTRYQVGFFSRSHASDISKARQVLGFQPQIALWEGIEMTVAWYRERGYLPSQGCIRQAGAQVVS